MPSSSPRRSLVAALINPEHRRATPPPLEVRLPPVILTGMAVWAVVLLVAAAATFSGAAGGRLCAVAGTGLALGCIALLWERRRRRRGHRANN